MRTAIGGHENSSGQKSWGAAHSREETGVAALVQPFPWRSRLALGPADGLVSPK